MLKRMSIFFIVMFSCISIASWAANYPSPSHPVHVKPYFKKDGKFVKNHYRSKPKQYRF